MSDRINMDRCHCCYCSHMGAEESRRYHAAEASRIANELDDLGDGFAEGGIVRFVLNERIKQERNSAGL